ncbi:MAG: AAA family ATPase [Chloroflexi bacterium]|nr:AAA family ATPase [Chloroflexota bacterium]
MDRVSLCIPRFDAIMGGGLPKHSLAILAGGPGVGKTIMALQLLFLSARKGVRSLYFSTLMDPKGRLLGFYKDMTFFSEEMVDNGVFFVDFSKKIREGNLLPLLSEMTKHIQDYRAELLIVDSFKAVSDIALGRPELWTFANELRSQLVEAGCTGILVGDYGLPGDISNPEFAVADAILSLEVQRAWNSVIRLFRVYKLRGSGFSDGYQAYEITNEGIKPIVADATARADSQETEASRHPR